MFDVYPIIIPLDLGYIKIPWVKRGQEVCLRNPI